MDYLKAFTIGTSGIVIFPHIFTVSNITTFDFSFKSYSLIAPIYFGIMSMLALYISKRNKISLQLGLFLTSILSIIIVVSLNYFVLSNVYSPYKNFDRKGWQKYILGNGLLHLFAFNVSIYLLEKYFHLYPVKIFVIGSSIFSYFITYLKVMKIDYKDKLNYDYKTFAVGEPFFQGLDLLVSLYILNVLMNYNLQESLSIWAVGGSILWLILAFSFKTYQYTGITWIYAFNRVLVTGIVKAFIIYYLIKNLNNT